MELQEGAFRAPAPVFGNKRALVAVSLRGGTLDVRGNTTRSGAVARPPVIRPGTDRSRGRALRRLARCPELLLLDLLEEHREGTVEDHGRIAVRDLAPEKGLKPPQLVVALLANRELDAIPVGRSRLDDRATCRERRRCTDRGRRFRRYRDRGLDGCRRRGREPRPRRRDGHGARKLPDGGRDVGLRRQLRDERFDLAATPIGGPCEHRLVVLHGERSAQ
jgi:hypothetical protein